MEGFISQYEPPFGLKPRKIPLLYYFALTSVFVVQSILNNLALNYDISIPLHTIFRSSSLAASLIVGILFFNKRYSPMQIISCLLVMVGIIIATLADAKGRGQAFPCCADSFQNSHFAKFWESVSLHGISQMFENTSSWAIGISLMIAALLGAAVLGHMQDLGYQRYGKVPQESVFYSHALALPIFIYYASDIQSHFLLIRQHPGVDIFGLRISLSLILLINMITQDLCIRGVFLLTSVSNTLTTTLTVTIRKFASLIFSILYFKNPFTVLHWVGSVLVFCGAALYSLTGKKSSSSESTTSIQTQTTTKTTTPSDSTSHGSIKGNTNKDNESRQRKNQSLNKKKEKK